MFSGCVDARREKRLAGFPVIVDDFPHDADDIKLLMQDLERLCRIAMTRPVVRRTPARIRECGEFRRIFRSS